MRLLMLAGPGAGKGTQARRLADHYGAEHLASGDLLRAEVKAGSEIGRKVDQLIAGGDLVPDEVILEVIGQRLIAAAQHRGYVLDGYPRNVAQAARAYELAHEIGGIELQAVVHLRVDPAELRRRMLARAEKEGRLDDTRAVIDHRLEVFAQQTEPLLDYYGARRLLHRVEGEQEVEEVTAAILESLRGVEGADPAR